MLDSMDGVWTHERIRVKPWRGEDATYVQPKYDGWCLTFFMQPDPANGLCVFGRKMTAELELSHLVEHRPWWSKLWDLLKRHPGTSVVAEAYVPGQPASAVTTALRDPSVPLWLCPFAIPYRDYRPTTQSLHDAYRELKGHGLAPPRTVQYTYQSRGDLLAYARQWDTEGVVLKAGHCEGWYKVKQEETVDLVCTGVDVAETGTEYAGLGASLRGALWRGGELVEIASVPGLSLEERTACVAVEGAPIGRVFEARYQYVGAGGRLRHPRFLRWRDDKPAEECTWDQLPRAAEEVPRG